MKIAILIAALLIITGFVFWKDINTMVAPGNDGKQAIKKDKKQNNSNDEQSANIVIREQWDLPEDLKEISGIAYLGSDNFACVQDELGTIFIFNTGSGKIEKKIAFGGTGDYEGLTVNGDIAYIVRADGRLFEIDMNEGIKSVKEFPTHLT